MQLFPNVVSLLEKMMQPAELRRKNNRTLPSDLLIAFTHSVTCCGIASSNTVSFVLIAFQ